MSLPVLNPHFFDTHKPSENFFQKWKNSATWSESLLPIYEWENCVFIGINQNTYNENTQPDFSFPHVLILVDPQVLKNIWLSYQTPQTPKQATPSDDPFSEIATQVVKSREDETLFDTFTHDSPPTSEEIPSPEETKPEELLELSPPETAAPPPPPLQPPEVAKKSDWTESIFDNLNSHFPYSMILLVNQDQALPWKWSESFKIQEPSPLDMKKPSPFYVLFRTHLPFHGSLAPSEELQKHCSQWGIKAYPQHLTAVPIKLNDRLIGVLASFGEAELYQASLLELCETSAKEIATAIQQQPQLLKAA